MPLAAPVAQKPQQEKEEVDEVEVQGQRAHDRSPADNRGVCRGIKPGRDAVAHILEALVVIRGQAGKNNNADHAEDNAHRVASNKQINNRRDNQPKKAHHHKASHAGQIPLGHQPVQSHGSKHRRGRHKRLEDARTGIHKKDRGQHESV